MTGRKVWTRERLTSADLNGYLMDQVVMRFPSASARATAIPSPSEGMVVTLDDTNETLRYDGAVWRSVSQHTGGYVSNQSDANGLFIVGHSLGAVPRWITVSPTNQQTAALDSVMKLLVWRDPAPSNTSFYVRAYRHDGANGTATPFSTVANFYWAAGL